MNQKDKNNLIKNNQQISLKMGKQTTNQSKSKNQPTQQYRN
jgi:hypothetical protein